MQNLKTIRTDVVGSLLRPTPLREARIALDEGRIGADAPWRASTTSVASGGRANGSWRYSC